MIWLAALAVLALVGYMGYETKQGYIEWKKPILPSPNHLPCGQCFWIVREMWTSKDPFPSNLIDQLIISVYCVEHSHFSYKRWNQKLLDDAGLTKPDVDNYRGFLEGSD